MTPISLCLYAYFARQRLGMRKLYRGNEYTHKNRRIVGCVVLCAVCII
jgi:hypothetical protein